MSDREPYKKQWWMRYFDVVISDPPETKAFFKKNRFTGATYVFRFNSRDGGNRWNEPGYGWGRWEKI